MVQDGMERTTRKLLRAERGSVAALEPAPIRHACDES